MQHPAVSDIPSARSRKITRGNYWIFLSYSSTIEGPQIYRRDGHSKSTARTSHREEAFGRSDCCAGGPCQNRAQRTGRQARQRTARQKEHERRRKAGSIQADDFVLGDEARSAPPAGGDIRSARVEPGPAGQHYRGVLKSKARGILAGVSLLPGDFGRFTS